MVPVQVENARREIRNTVWGNRTKCDWPKKNKKNKIKLPNL